MIKTENGKVRVITPYNHKFVADAKALGGKWSDPEWVFDSRLEAQVRELHTKYYGDGTTFDFTMKVNTYPFSSDTFSLYGHPIARRRSRDASVQMADGVAVLEGHFGSSGGSAKHPMVFGRLASDSVTLRILDFPLDPRTFPKSDDIEILDVVGDVTKLPGGHGNSTAIASDTIADGAALESELFLIGKTIERVEHDAESGGLKITLVDRDLVRTRAWVSGLTIHT